MAADLRKDPETHRGGVRRIAEQLGIHTETLRDWVKKAEIDDGTRPGVTTAETARIQELEREVREESTEPRTSPSGQGFVQEALPKTLPVELDFTPPMGTYVSFMLVGWRRSMSLRQRIRLSSIKSASESIPTAERHHFHSPIDRIRGHYLRGTRFPTTRRG